MDGSEQDITRPELSDSWMVINDSPTGSERDHGAPSDGSDGESVEVIDQEDYDEVLAEETAYDAIPPEEELSGPKNKKYVHHPNRDVNAALNMLMVIAASIVVGLAVGHYLGYAEEVNDMATTLKKLETENIRLKNHVCRTLENCNNQFEHVTRNNYPELKYINESYAIFITVLLNIKCPALEALTVGIQTTLDDLKEAHMKGYLSDSELQGKIDEILSNQSHDHKVINHVGSSNNLAQNQKEHITSAGKKIVSTASELTEIDIQKEQSSEINFHLETSLYETPEESTSTLESKDFSVADTVGNLSEDAQTQTEATTETSQCSVSVKPPTVTVVADTVSDIDNSEDQSDSNSKELPTSSEVPAENTIKHIVKNIVQEMADSLLVLHHNNIMKDIRDEVNKLLQSVPVFKSALLLNLEVISRLKFHLTFIKDTFHSLLDNSQALTYHKKITRILNDVSHHTLSLKKALNSLRLLEAALNQKREMPIKRQRINVCTVPEFFSEFYIDTDHSVQHIHHFSVHTEKCTQELSSNPHNTISANLSTSSNNEPKDASIENVKQKNAMGKNNGEKVSNLANLQQPHEDMTFIDKHAYHGRPSKYDEKMPYDYKENKREISIKQDSDNHEYTKSKLRSIANEKHNKKHVVKKHKGNHKDSKNLKESPHERVKELKKKHHYKQQKPFKREQHDIRKKNFNNMHRWDKDKYDHGHSNVSGEWIIDMSRGRAECRDNEHRSDWLFERASARKAKRNGKWDISDWYFQRAEGRKYCRQKSNNRKSKMQYSPPKDIEKELHDRNSKKFSRLRKYFKPKRWISKAYMTVSKLKF